MKIEVTFKDPDGPYECVQDAVRADIAQRFPEATEAEREQLAETRAEAVRKKLSKWFEYGEYITVIVDTDADTCTVVPVK